MNKLKTSISLVIKYRIVIMIVLGVLMAIAGYQTHKNLRIDNSLTIWFLEDDPSYKAYIDFQETFGSDEIFVAMFPVENAIGQTEMASLSQLTQTIEALPYVKTSFSLAKAKYPVYGTNKIVFDNLYTTKRSEKGLKLSLIHI